ncbi:MAG: hypothetical protein QW221_01185 [Candidatus Korarchaeum sp.]
MRYKLAALFLIPILVSPMVRLEAQGQELDSIRLYSLMGEARRSADFMNLLARAKSMGFKEVKYLGFDMKSEGLLVLGAMLSRGEDNALLIFELFDDGYSEAYLYMLRGDRVLLDSFSRSGVITVYGKSHSTCPIVARNGRSSSTGIGPLEAGRNDCYSSGCRPCCSAQIGCPSGRYADCKYICDSWNYGCLINCGVTLVGCATSCADCIAGSRLACGFCIARVLASPWAGESLAVAPGRIAHADA